MSDAKLGSSYDDKFSGMELGKLRATVAEQEAEIERLRADGKKVEQLQARASSSRARIKHLENQMSDLIIGEPDVIRKEDNILWLRAEIERLQSRIELLEGVVDLVKRGDAAQIFGFQEFDVIRKAIAAAEEKK